MDEDDSTLDPTKLRPTLQTYKKLSKDVSNHDTILKVGYLIQLSLEFYLSLSLWSICFLWYRVFSQDKTVLSYVAVVLEYPDDEVVHLALDILETFVKNVENYNHITSTFGVREALDAVVNKYALDEPKLAKRAQQIKDDIERMKPPIYNLRSRCRRVIEPKKLRTHVIVLHVHGLLPVSWRFVILSIKPRRWLILILNKAG